MINPPADAEKTTTPPGGGETTPPVAETETISKAELAKLRTQAGYSSRKAEEIANLEETKAELAAYKLKEQVQQVAAAQGVDPNLLMEIAPRLTKEELENFAKKLPKSGEKAASPMKLYSGKTDGGSDRLGDLPPLERMKRVAEKLRQS